MAHKYNQGVTVSSTRFTKAPLGEIEYSKMYGEPTHTTTFDGGEIVPIYCNEVLPHDTFSVDIDAVVRQATLMVPTMDRAIIDIFAYFVPNRVVNKSWVNVMGENTSGSWIAPEVSLVPLLDKQSPYGKIPVGSVADYYGYPTQDVIPRDVLMSCHDLKIRGYLEIYNNYFRDQNYQPPIAYSKLNVYNGFLDNNEFANYDVEGNVTFLPEDTVPDGSVGAGAIAKELLGSSTSYFDADEGYAIPRYVPFKAYNKPLKANKLHDYFTSVLPSPQKGQEALIPLGYGTVPVVSADESHHMGSPIQFGNISAPNSSSFVPLGMSGMDSHGQGKLVARMDAMASTSALDTIVRSNLVAELAADSVSLSVNDIRMSAAIQQVYEILGRAGSRYTEYINAFFGLDTDNPFLDIPTCLGHIRRDLDLYQTAQTSQTTETSSQGDLAAFGYTSTGGNLFTRTFLEHGYIHIMAVVRHRNIYPSLMSRDNFRLSMMDFYQYPLANISEQPVYTREINPFAGNDQVFGYQEAWAEYRMEPDRVSGYIRSGIDGTLSQWSYVDDFDGGLLISDGDWLQSNTKNVIARGTALRDEQAPQFKAKFSFKITKQRPMPTYSMSGMDII